MIGINCCAVWNGGKIYNRIGARRMPTFTITTAMVIFGLVAGTAAILFGLFRRHFFFTAFFAAIARKGIACRKR